MLLQHFKFNEEPFGTTPDPRFLFESHTHREALASLYCAFYSNRGFTALIAPPGMGKTTLLTKFLNQISTSARTVFLFDAQCEPHDLIRHIVRDLGLAPSSDVVELHQQLNEVLAGEARLGRKVVVVLDEAQNLSEAALEKVRLLTNFETSQNKLLQVVLSGQPELSKTLLRPSLTQLRQRISTICRLTPLSCSESKEYIAHRLRVAGYVGKALFTSAASSLIVSEAVGTPRLINQLCFNALALCQALNRNVVSEDMVAEVIDDLRLPSEHEGSLQRNLVTASRPVAHQQKPRRVRAIHIGRAGAASAVVVLGLWYAASPPNFALQEHTTSHQETVASRTKPAVRPPTMTPAEVTVQPNQTLAAISKLYLGVADHKSIEQIKSLNPKLTDLNHIESGQKIRLPQAPHALGNNADINAGDE